MKKISDRHKSVIDIYITNGMNKTKAIIDAGYSEKYAHKNTTEIFSRLEVQDYLEKQRSKLQKKFEVTKEKLGNILMNRVLLFEQMQELGQKEKLTPQEYDKYTRLMSILKASDANKAIDQLSKMFGFNEPTKFDHTSNGQTIQPPITWNDEEDEK